MFLFRCPVPIHFKRTVHSFKWQYWARIIRRTSTWIGNGYSRADRVKKTRSDGAEMRALVCCLRIRLFLREASRGFVKELVLNGKDSPALIYLARIIGYRRDAIVGLHDFVVVVVLLLVGKLVLPNTFQLDQARFCQALQQKVIISIMI